MAKIEERRPDHKILPPASHASVIGQGPFRRSWAASTGQSPFEQSCVALTGFSCFVVRRVPQCDAGHRTRNATQSTEQENPACGGPYRPAGGVLPLARCPASRGATRLAGRTDPAHQSGSGLLEWALAARPAQNGDRTPVLVPARRVVADRNRPLLAVRDRSHPVLPDTLGDQIVAGCGRAPGA